MRDILFRGKRVDKGQWIEGYYSKCKNNHYIDYEYNEVLTSFTVTPETVGQFIGILDKNGKKIFEGDILRHSDKFGSIIAKVIYERMGYRLISLKEPIYWNFHSEFEIIGNIHDSAELLCK